MSQWDRDVRFGSKVGQIGPKMDKYENKFRTYYFSTSGSAIQNVLKMFCKHLGPI